jgi:hypothetical protein
MSGCQKCCCLIILLIIHFTIGIGFILTGAIDVVSVLLETLFDVALNMLAYFIIFLTSFTDFLSFLGILFMLAVNAIYIGIFSI